MGDENFKQLIRNLRIKKEFEDFCKKKGINILLGHKIANYMFLDYTNQKIAQREGLHLSTVVRYRKVLGSLEESKFNQILKFPKIALLDKNTFIDKNLSKI